VNFHSKILHFLGLMVFQGLEIVSKNQFKKMNIVGTVLDSCPGNFVQFDESFVY